MATPKREADGDVDDTANCFEFYAGLATKIHGETMQVPSNSFSYVVREPIGVCAQNHSLELSFADGLLEISSCARCRKLLHTETI
jgi:hypothetical protein